MKKITSSPKQMSSNRQNTFSSTDDAVIQPLDIMTLDEPNALFDRLESSARDLTTWLRMLQSSLDDILTPTANKASPVQDETDEAADTPSMHI
jgi:hypothetical protein